MNAKRKDDEKNDYEDALRLLGFKSKDMPFYSRIAAGIRPENPVLYDFPSTEDRRLSESNFPSEKNSIEGIFSSLSRYNTSNIKKHMNRLMKNMDAWRSSPTPSEISRELLLLCLGAVIKGQITGRHYYQLQYSQKIRIGNALDFLYKNSRELFDTAEFQLNFSEEKYEQFVIRFKYQLDKDSIDRQETLSAIHYILTTTEYIRTSDLVIALDIDRKSAYELLNELYKHEALKRIGSGRSTTYRMNDSDFASE